MLVPPSLGKPLKLYISGAEDSIGSLLSQNSEDETEQTVYYLSRLLNDAETIYTLIDVCPCFMHVGS